MSPKVLVVGDGLVAELTKGALHLAGFKEASNGEAPDILWLAEEIDVWGKYDPPREFWQNVTAEVICSTPVPLGTSEWLASPRVGGFTYLLENVRRGDRQDDFPRRPLVRGRAGHRATPIADELLPRVFGVGWMEMTASQAELTKHALNSLLATCAAWSEEIRLLAGSDAAADLVARAVRSDPRFGEKMPILPKGRYSSHLNRDITGLLMCGKVSSSIMGCLPLLEAVSLYKEEDLA